MNVLGMWVNSKQQLREGGNVAIHAAYYLYFA